MASGRSSRCDPYTDTVAAIEFARTLIMTFVWLGRLACEDISDRGDTPLAFRFLKATPSCDLILRARHSMSS
jgi:hypothetical protein